MGRLNEETCCLRISSFMLLTHIDKDFHPLEIVAVTTFSICPVVMGKEVQTSLKITSSEHSIKAFHLANRLSGSGISETLESRLRTDMPKYKTVHPPHSRQGNARRIGGLLSRCLARRCGSVDVEIKSIYRHFRKTLNPDNFLNFSFQMQLESLPFCCCYGRGLPSNTGCPIFCWITLILPSASDWPFLLYLPRIQNGWWRKTGGLFWCFLSRIQTRADEKEQRDRFSFSSMCSFILNWEQVHCHHINMTPIVIYLF